MVLEANRLKLYQVDDKMMPIYTELVKELVLETGTMTVTPSKCTVIPDMPVDYYYYYFG